MYLPPTPLLRKYNGMGLASPDGDLGSALGNSSLQSTPLQRSTGTDHFEDIMGTSPLQTSPISSQSDKEWRRQQQERIISRAQSIVEQRRSENTSSFRDTRVGDVNTRTPEKRGHSNHNLDAHGKQDERMQRGQNQEQATPGKKSVLFAIPVVQSEFSTPTTKLNAAQAPMSTPIYEQFQLHHHIGFTPLYQDVKEKMGYFRQQQQRQKLQQRALPFLQSPLFNPGDLAIPKVGRQRTKQNRGRTPKRTTSRDLPPRLVHGVASRTMHTPVRLSNEQRSKLNAELSKQELRVHEISNLKKQAAELLHQGMFQQAIETAKFCRDKVESTFGDKHIDCIYLNILLGEAYTHCGGGLFQLANESFDKARSIIESSDLESDMQLWRFAEILYSDIGYLMRLQGRLRDALEAYKKTHALQQRQYGEESLPCAQTMCNIALVLTSLGQFQDALDLLDKARSIRTDILGGQHLDVATVLNNIGNVHLYMGHYKKALQYYSKGKSILEHNGQTQHPDYATCLVNIGSALKELKQFEQALLMYQKAQTLREQVLGKDHNLTAATYLFIGYLLLSQDVDPFGQSFDKGDEPSAHPADDTFFDSKITNVQDTSISSCRTIGELEEQRREQLRQAREYIEAALSVRLRTLGQIHSETASCYNALGHVYLRELNFGESMKCYQTARQICSQIGGGEHPETIQCEENIVNLMLLIGKKGEDALKRLLRIASYKKKFYGKNHPSTATMYNTIGNVLRQQGRLEQAREMYFKARDIYERSYGFEHQSTAIIYTNIGHLYRYEGHHQEALRWYIKARSIRERLYGENHIETLFSIKNIALVYMEQEKYDLALEALHHCKDTLIAEYDFQNRIYVSTSMRLRRRSLSSSSSSSGGVTKILDTTASTTAQSLIYHRHSVSSGDNGDDNDEISKRRTSNLIELEVLHLGQLIARVVRLKHRKEMNANV